MQWIIQCNTLHLSPLRSSLNKNVYLTHKNSWDSKKVNSLIWVVFKKLLSLKFLPNNSDLKIHQFLRNIHVPWWKGKFTLMLLTLYWYLMKPKTTDKRLFLFSKLQSISFFRNRCQHFQWGVFFGGGNEIGAFGLDSKESIKYFIKMYNFKDIISALYYRKLSQSYVPFNILTFVYQMWSKFIILKISFDLQSFNFWSQWSILNVQIPRGK